MKQIEGYLVDIESESIFPARVTIEQKKIAGISKLKSAEERYILPGFIDAHVHIESSMLTPAEFARLAVVHGVVATVSDPHEIANVLGLEGIVYMIENAEKVNFKIYFGASSCVPATPFETAGAKVTAKDIETLFRKYKVKYLGEMMNWPGVLNDDPEVLAKIALAKKFNAPVDGHAPGLMGDDAVKYIKAGISADHECYQIEEALHKLKHGMKIIIREGSAAKNYEELHELLFSYPDQVMFCSDDKHPDELVKGHINSLVVRSIRKGVNLFNLLRAACLNPVRHYDLDVGLLQPGDPADFIVVDSLLDFNVLQTWINGELVAENGKTKIPRVESAVINHFNTGYKFPNDFLIKSEKEKIPVIEAMDQQLITHKIEVPARKDQDGFLLADPENDILKIIVANRYQDVKPAVAFVKNFGLKEGAIASSVAHDSHNIIAVGVNDDFLSRAVNLVIDQKGGAAAVSETQEMVLPLPVAGLMSIDDGYRVAALYEEIDGLAKEMGSTLASPFMTLSFMALLVIPSLKLSDKGLFDGEQFEFVTL